MSIFADILQAQDYCTNNQFVRDVIDEDIRRELHNLGNDLDTHKSKKGKTSHEQILNNLKTGSGDKFKYLWADDNAQDYDYEEEEKRKRDKEMQMVLPQKYQVIGYNTDEGARIKRKPILRMSDFYLTTNPKVRRIVNRIFDRHIYGKSEPPKTHDNGVLISKSTSNYQELQDIIKKYENQDDEYYMENQQVNMNEEQLEEYIIERGQSKSSYFLFYRNQEPPKVDYDVLNNPLNSEHFIKRLHTSVKQKQRQYNRIEEPSSQEESEEEDQSNKNKEKKELQDKKKDYFGQFKRTVKSGKVQGTLKVEDNFDNKVQSGEQLAKNIINHYSYLDCDILKQQYKRPKQDNERLELNLSNPHFFQPKLHTILHRETELMKQHEFNQRIADVTRTYNAGRTVISGDRGFSRYSASQAQGLNHLQNQEQNQTIEDFVNQELKNISRQPIKHSQIATKFQFVKFTLQQDVFNHYHRHFFPFHEHLKEVKARVDFYVKKHKEAKPNGLVINAEMKQSNDKFYRKEDLSCSKGEFILVQYIEETPILMSDVGMCERMFIQVNYLEILRKMREEIFNLKSIDQVQEERDKLVHTPISYRKHAPLWRQLIKEYFGENGKQFYWEPKANTGKVIGVPEGPGVIVMESNLGIVPLVKKKSPTRDFLLIREGKKWVLRRMDNVYVAGQVESSKKVFCPGSRQHTDFKLSYELAYIVKHIKEYGIVNLDQLKLNFKGETENSLRKALKTCNATAKDAKNFKISQQVPTKSEHVLSPEEICLYERMQKSLCELKEVGICDIRSNEKMKNVLKEFNKKHYLNPQKIAIARVIRQQLQLTSWYLTDSFLKYKQRASKIQISGFADPTNGRGGYSFINKPQKQRTAREDMEERVQKQKSSTLSDLRKLNCESSRQRLREMGFNENEIGQKGRWALIRELKNQQGTQFSRKQRQTKMQKQQNERKQISRSFNRLLCWLRDQQQQPAFDYNSVHRNRLEDYLKREGDYIAKINRRYLNKQNSIYSKQDQQSDSQD